MLARSCAQIARCTAIGPHVWQGPDIQCECISQSLAIERHDPDAVRRIRVEQEVSHVLVLREPVLACVDVAASKRQSVREGTKSRS